MNKSPIAIPCTDIRPSCLSEAPENFTLPSTTFELQSPWCNENGYTRWLSSSDAVDKLN